MPGAIAIVCRVAALLLLSMAQAGLRAQPVPSPAPSPQAVQQKATMVERVLNQSPLANRVAIGPSEPARRHMSNARELLGHAGLLASSGQVAAADQLLNASLWEIGRARLLLPEPAAPEASERSRAAQREELALREAGARLAGQTLVYDRRFATPRQEFDHELERHRSFERLVPVAIERFRPGLEARTRVDQFLIQARVLREKGEALAADDVPGATRLVAEGTEALHGALQAAGLVVQQAPGSDR